VIERLPIGDVQPEDYIRRGPAENMRRVKAVRPRQGWVEVEYDGRATDSFERFETVDVARTGGELPPAWAAELRAVMNSLPVDTPEDEVRAALVAKAMDLGMADPEIAADSVIDWQSRPAWLVRLGPLGQAVSMARTVFTANRAVNPRWVRPPLRTNWNGLATEQGGRGRPLSFEPSPAAPVLFDRIRHEMEIQDDGWHLDPWLAWDHQLNRVTVSVGSELIGYLSQPDSDDLGSKVRESSKAPVASGWLTEAGEFSVLTYV
jgi:hypothetical protein